MVFGREARLAREGFCVVTRLIRAAMTRFREFVKGICPDSVKEKKLEF
jgi:hypothetical protein